MTAPDPADTVTQQAVKVIRNHSEHGFCMTAECSEDLLPQPYPRNRDDRNAFWDHHIARALHAAGLLVDPASTGSRMVDQLIREREECKAAWKRAEAELRATVAAVRSVCQNTDGDWLDGDAEIPVGEVLRMLTLDGTRALDGAGEQP